MNIADWIVIGWLVPMWLLSTQAWRQFQRIRFGLEPRPHDRAYWSMRSFM